MTTQYQQPFMVQAEQLGPWSVSFGTPQHVILDSGTLTSITNPVTVVQPTAANFNATIVGTGTLLVQAQQSGSWTTGRTWTLDSSTDSVTVAPITFASPQHVILDSGTLTSITNPVAVTQSGTWTTGRTWTLNSGTDSVTVAPITFSVPQHVILDSGTLTSITNPVTVAQATAANLNATVVGTGTFAVQAACTQTTSPWVTSFSAPQHVILDSGTLTGITNNVTVVGTGTFAVQSTPSASTAGGFTPFRNTAVSNTAVAVKASAGTLYYVNAYNTNSADAYLQFYDLAAGSVTVGTTTPKWSMPLPASAVEDQALTIGMGFGTAIAIAVTTTPTGSTAPSTAVLVNLGYA